MFAHHRRVLAFAASFLAISVLVVLDGGALTIGTIEGLESARAQELVDRVRGFPEATTVAVIFRSDTLDPDDDGFQSQVTASLARAKASPHVRSVLAPDDLPPSVGLLMTNGQERALLAYVTLAGELRDALASYPEVRALLEGEGPGSAREPRGGAAQAGSRLQVTCTGRVPYVHDLDRTLERDLLLAELVSLPLALLVLILVFRTWTAALLPIAVGIFSVLGSVAAVLLLSRVHEIAQYTINVCSLIGLGVSIDYSLFFVSRYREELAAGHAPVDAVARAQDAAGRVVVFSGIAVTSGLAGLASFRGSYLEAMGIGGAIVVAFAVIAALTVLPALLAALGPRLRPSRPHAAGAGRWGRVAARVMARPLLFLVPTLGVLVPMGLPFLHLHLAAADVRVLPEDVEARRGYELLRTAFPELAATRVAVAIQLPAGSGLDPERIGAIYDLVQRIRAIPHVTKVESIIDPVIAGTREEVVRELLDPQPLLATAVREVRSLLTRDEVVVLYALTDRPPEDEAAREIVRSIRRERSVAVGTLSVGGTIAHDVDTTDFILGHAPRAVLIVVGATTLALFSMLGSVLLPLKALLMNLLSIAGSFGALVWVFQDGNLFVTQPRPVEPTLPVLLFCVLFGLSMDYEVLMLGRIKEVWEETGDNTRAVAEGLERSAGLITSAAAIMIAVFGAFALGRVVLIQAVGFGMALAVALDATLVRVILVPATMRLFGDLNWWLPAPLARLRRRLGFTDRAGRGPAG